MLSVDQSRQLDGLALGHRSAVTTMHAAGARLARARGLGMEFHEFRPYLPGDEPRSIDWTIHARLQQLVVRVRRADARLRVHLLIDTSASMVTGAVNKLSCATRLAAALAYVGLRQRDAVGLALFTDTITSVVAPAAGRPQLHRLFEILTTCRGRGRSAIDRVLTSFGDATTGPGLVVVLSDFFHDSDARVALRYLLHRNLTPVVVQVLAPEELEPLAIDETVELVDAEHPDAPPLVMDARGIAGYRERFSRQSGELGEFCAARGLPCVRIVATSTFDEVLDSCVRAGVLTGRG